MDFASWLEEVDGIAVKELIDREIPFLDHVPTTDIEVLTLPKVIRVKSSDISSIRAVCSTCLMDTKVLEEYNIIKII